MNHAASWPEIIRPLVEANGSGRVWRAGLDALGYPPTWVHTFAEVKRVHDQLNAE